MKINHKNLGIPILQTVKNGDWGYIIADNGDWYLGVVAQTGLGEYQIISVSDKGGSPVNRWTDDKVKKGHENIPVNELLHVGEKWIPVEVEITVK